MTDHLAAIKPRCFVKNYLKDDFQYIPLLIHSGFCRDIENDNLNCFLKKASSFLLISILFLVGGARGEKRTRR